MIRAVFFDLDGTLLPMNEEKFEKIYFSTLSSYLIPYGYDSKKVLNGILLGVGAMMKNESGLSNEDVFWNTFNQFMGKDCTVDKPIFEQYYKTIFPQTLAACEPLSISREIIDYCRKNYEILVLSTNPLFPAIATHTRMAYVNLKPEDFDLVTTYENFGYCKPNPKYFQTLLEKFNLKPEEVIVVGNDTLEDCECSSMVGIQSVLVKGNILYKKGTTKTCHEIERHELIDYLKSLK